MELGGKSSFTTSIVFVSVFFLKKSNYLMILIGFLWFYLPICIICDVNVN